jgi:hypothetical protein
MPRSVYEGFEKQASLQDAIDEVPHLREQRNPPVTLCLAESNPFSTNNRMKDSSTPG